MRGSTMCSSYTPGAAQCCAAASAMAAGVSLPSVPGMAITLWPVASMAPVSCTLIWPVSAATMASHGRRNAAAASWFVCVPPTRKCTSASGQAKRARMASAARRQSSSSP